jgi:hypothetical protein
VGYKVAMLGSLMDRPVAAAGNVEGEAKRFAVWKDVAASTASMITTRCGQSASNSTSRRRSIPARGVGVSGCRLQPYRPFRRRQPRHLQGDVSRWHDAPLPRP